MISEGVTINQLAARRLSWNMKRLNDDETLLLITFVHSRECLWNENNADFKRISITRKLWKEIGTQLNISGEEAKSKWKNLRDKFKKLLQRQALEEMEPSTSTEVPSVTMPKWKFYDAMLFIKDVLMRNHEQQLLGNTSMNNTVSGSADQDLELLDEYFQEYNVDFLVKRTPDRESPPKTSSGLVVGKSSCSNSGQLQPKGIKRKNTDVGDGEEKEKDEQLQLSELSSEVRIQRKKSEDDYYFLMSLLPYIKTLNPLEKLELRSKMQNLVTDSYKRHDLMNKFPRM